MGPSAYSKPPNLKSEVVKSSFLNAVKRLDIGESRRQGAFKNILTGCVGWSDSMNKLTSLQKQNHNICKKRASEICEVVERPDHHLVDDLVLTVCWCSKYYFLFCNIVEEAEFATRLVISFSQLY